MATPEGKCRCDSRTRDTKTAFESLSRTNVGTSGCMRRCGGSPFPNPTVAPRHVHGAVKTRPLWPHNDWMEWQAGYVCGALLMPRSEILPLTKNFAGTDENNFSSNSDFGRATIGWIARRCPLNRNRQNRSIFATITSNGSSERFHPWFAYRPLRSTIFVSMQSCSRNLEPSVFRT
jgi:hypothetical protein